CGACATQILSTSTALVRVAPKGGLPALSQREKATLGSVAVGLTAVALRVGVRLLKQAVAQRTEKKERPVAPVEPPTPTPRTGVMIRRRWVIGNSLGPLRWGEEEIQIEEPRDDRGAYRIIFK
ncbi:MAG: hypothetical protein ACRDIB_14390, partial [Ardenticatenaceae bacterium]